jgi:lincosamide nucleotidyltransferase A/C/D/E
MMTSRDVVELYGAFKDAGVEIWVDGGWSVDACLGRQLRAHGDLDIAVQWKDVPRLREVMTARGYVQVRDEGQWNFVLADDTGRELDVHAVVFGDDGSIVEGIKYPDGSLTGAGTIDGVTVRCIDATHMVGFLAPYISKWPEKYVQAVGELCEAFGLELPREYVEFMRGV